MAQAGTIGPSAFENKTLRRWISRAFLISILVYVAVIGYLVAGAVMGASRWAPYGVNIPLFIALTIASEVIITLTAAWIFREDAGIWPAAVSEGWAELRSGLFFGGLRKLLVGVWDVALIDLRLRTPRAILLGRMNRVAALVPLVYVLGASASGAPWGMRSFALLDIAVTLVVWAFMELAMVRPTAEPARAAVRVPEALAREPAAAPAPRAAARASKQSAYEVRPVEPADLNRILEIERIKWKDQAATEEMVLSRLRVFPEGQLAAVHVSLVNGVQVSRKLVAWCTAMPASERQVRSFRSWESVTAKGSIRNSDRKGNVLIGVNLTSVTEGATFMLSGEALVRVVEWGKAKLMTGSRLNGFVALNERRANEGRRALTADEYARLREIRGYRLNEARVDAGLAPLTDRDYVRTVARMRADAGLQPLDAEEAPDHVCSNLRGYLGIPGVRIVEVIPDYFEDPASKNYGVLIEWVNPLPVPLRHVPWVKRWAVARIRREVQAELERRREQVHERAARRALEQVPEFLRRGAETEEGAPVATPEAVPEESSAAAPEGAGQQRE